LSGLHTNADLQLPRGNLSANAVEPTAALPSVDSFFPQRQYSPDSPLCFVHVAKAAGTTVRLVMENAFDGDRTFPSGSSAFEGRYLFLTKALKVGDDLSRFDALSGHFGARDAELLGNRANVFTWLREPAERVISQFFFFVQDRQPHLRHYLERLDQGDRIETVFLDWLADQPAGWHRLQGSLVTGHNKVYADWKRDHPEMTLTEAAIEALRRCFFIGLVEDQERSLDAFCALTSILPPKLTTRRNALAVRPKRFEFTAEEQAGFERLLAPDRAFYALAKEVYARQMAGLAAMAGTKPALSLVGDRKALREFLLREAARRVPVLTEWKAWDPILGENLDGREQFKAADGTVSRWRWTGSGADTFLYFRLPKGTGFELVFRLNPATPPRHAQSAALRVEGEALPLSLREGNNGRAELVATIARNHADRLPALAELHLHTPVMLDESTLVPYAGTRRLGLAIESISAVPLGTPAPSGVRSLRSTLSALPIVRRFRR
jgi:hypothetical protein